MKLYVQFMIILVFSFLGEAISTIFHLPIPGSIIGLILLFLALEFKLIRLRHIHTVGNFLLANMTILFCLQQWVLWRDLMQLKIIYFLLSSSF